MYALVMVVLPFFCIPIGEEEEPLFNLSFLEVTWYNGLTALRKVESVQYQTLLSPVLPAAT